jgi:PST family polysaccharide transporter
VTTILIVALNPIGVVLLPTLARNWAQDRRRTSQQVAKLSAFAVHVGLFTLGQMALFADLAVRYWLGPRFSAAAPIVRVIVLSVPPLAYYLALRSSLDAVSVRSYNSASNIAALAVFAVVAAVMLGFHLASPAISLAWAYSLGIAMRGALTFAYVHRLFELGREEYRLAGAVPLALAAAAAALLMKPLIEGSSMGLLLVSAVELTLATAYFGGLVRLGIPWTRQLLKR